MHQKLDTHFRGGRGVIRYYELALPQENFGTTSLIIIVLEKNKLLKTSDVQINQCMTMSIYNKSTNIHFPLINQDIFQKVLKIYISKSKYKVLIIRTYVYMS